jgi:hypothetical protein
MPFVNIPTLTDWQYDEDIKKLRHNTGTARVTVNALYSALMDLADDSGFMDSDPPMTAQTPSEYSLVNGWTMEADSDFGFLTSGAIRVTATDDLWACFYNLGTLKAGTVIYIEQNGALVASPPGYASGSIDVLVKVRALGADIDARRVTLLARNLGDSYDAFTIQAPATGGFNPVPLSTATDINDSAATASDGGITITFGATSQNIGDGGGLQPYSVIIDGAGMTALQVYRALKFRLRRANTTAIGTGTSVQGRFYRLANVAYPEVKNAAFGSFAGGKFFGAQGVWLTNISDPNSRELTDNNGVARTPPVSITVNVTGLVATDRVLVARGTAGVINKSQFTIASTTASTVGATTTPAADIPASGVIRIGDTRYTYSGRTGATFSGVSPSPAGATGPFYVPLIDDAAAGTSMASPAIQYVADFEVIARVRKKGILPFQNSATVTSAGAAISAIRTADAIVT